MSTPRRTRARRGSGEQLRAEIVAAAKKLLAEAGNADKVSIRAVADAVGVTPPSIYLHFADKDALLDAVVTDVFADLDTAILAAAERTAGQSPLAVLLAQGLAYVHFAVEHPEHYRLAAMDPCVVPPDVDEMLRDGAFLHFMDTVQACMDARIFPAGDPLPIALDLWTAAHGVAALLIAKPYLPWGTIDEIGGRALKAAGLGHAVVGLADPDDDVEAVVAWLAEQRGHKPRARKPPARNSPARKSPARESR
jgi:AcrR family transcriptional regulator